MQELNKTTSRNGQKRVSTFKETMPGCTGVSDVLYFKLLILSIIQLTYNYFGITNFVYISYDYLKIDTLHL